MQVFGNANGLFTGDVQRPFMSALQTSISVKCFNKELKEF